MSMESESAMATPTRKVAVVGYLPESIDLKSFPGIGLTASSIRDDIVEVGRELAKEGIDLHQFFIDIADPSVTFKDLSFAIKMNNYEAIIIGGGMRKYDAHLTIFENLLNLLLHERQTFKIGLNLNPKNTYATCKRLLSDSSDKK